MNIESIQNLLTRIQMEFPGCTKPVIIIKTNKIDVDRFNKMITEYMTDPTLNLIEYSGEQLDKPHKFLSLVFHNGKIQIEENGE